MELADVVYKIDDIAVAISSGSFQTMRNAGRSVLDPDAV